MVHGHTHGDNNTVLLPEEALFLMECVSSQQENIIQPRGGRESEREGEVESEREGDGGSGVLGWDGGILCETEAM